MRIPLTLKLVAGFAIAAIAAMVVLSLWFGPNTEQAFRTRSEALVAESREAMRGLAEQSSARSRDVLVSLIRNETDARKRALEDLPISLYGGEPERIREAISEHDSRRGERIVANADLLAAEMKRRAEGRIAKRVDDLASAQSERGEGFAGEMRDSALVLQGGLLVALFGLLGFGLWRFVVRPLRSLREATRAVASGSLDVEIGAATGRDEVGDLAEDFAAMLERLRSSRRELEALNAGLEDEVARKTEHLERARAKLVHAEKMASVGTLAGGIAHEFNNLIGGIRGCAREALADAQPELREPLQIILRATDRGAEITDRLLHFAKPRVAVMAEVDVASIVDDAVRLAAPEARRLGVEVAWDRASVAPLEADGDALHQVFVNLISNALKAMPDGGRLELSIDDGRGELLVRVCDDGVGIPEEHLAQIFDPFFTSREVTAEAGERGTGLGLSVSYGIVEAHGGTIEVTSRLGEGSEFCVRLPRSVKAA